MISKTTFEPFNYLIKTLLANEPLLSIEPFIAGGFPLAVFAELKKVDTAQDWQTLYERVNRDRLRAISLPFRDIDLFFLRDNPVWSGKDRWLVAESLEEADCPPDNRFGLTQPKNTHYNKWVNIYEKNHQGNSICYQFGKQQQTSIEFCLAHFDLKICCIAWHKDQLYFHESFEETFDLGRIETNPFGFRKRSRGDLYTRAFTVSRAYKYADRLGFILSEELEDYCKQVYADTQTVDFNVDDRLRDLDGRLTHNPVPSSPAFRGVIRKFQRVHEAYQARASRPTDRRVEKESARPDSDPLKKLTIGMATFDDYDGVYFSVQAIRLFHPEVTDETEILVIDNNPGGPCAKALNALGDWVKGYRYVPNDTVSGTAVRNFVFQEARTDYVLCIDSHVLIEAGRIRQLIDYFETKSKPGDLLQGPLLMDDMRSCYTHFKPEWRGGMYGIWDYDERGADPGNEPFDIPMQGLGLFACRREDWPGFSPRFSGFGGEEGYIHEKFRSKGGRTLCLPFLRWIHRFERPMGTHYQNKWEDRIRNYLIGFSELDMDSAGVEKHFAEFLDQQTVDRVKNLVELEKDNPFDFFDAIYCINLDSETGRWQQMMKRFERLGIAYRVKRFSAVEHKTNHHIGCALSHIAILEEAREQGYGNVLVIEDDALFHDDSLEHLANAVQELRTQQWSVFYLGGMNWGKRYEKLNGCRYLERPIGMTCTHSVAYNSNIYEKILSDIPTDGRLEAWIRKYHGIDQYLRFQKDLVVMSPVVSTQVQLEGAVPESMADGYY